MPKLRHIYIPGFACSPAIFEKWAKPDNAIMLSAANPVSAINQARTLMQEDANNPVHITGFSMGANMALQLYKQCPDQVKGLTLMGLRPAYAAADLDPIREQIESNCDMVVSNFHRACFNHSGAYRQFRKDGLHCHEGTHREALLSGLDFLESNPVTTDDVPLFATLLHGRSDAIAPLSEIAAFAGKKGLTLTQYNGGHLFFWDLLQGQKNKVFSPSASWNSA